MILRSQRLAIVKAHFLFIVHVHIGQQQLSHSFHSETHVDTVPSFSVTADPKPK